MQLPKNITQIGESDIHCKRYVEDYVVSYLKQMNLPAADKNFAVALYGVRKEENGISYLFVYGACKLNFLQKEARHISQAGMQEIEKLRKKYFGEYDFLGYRLLSGEMIEGFHVCEQGICRYIEGYAQFYEKNDSMLAYMLDTREDCAEPEKVDTEKYEAAKKHQEERRSELVREQESRGKYRTSFAREKNSFTRARNAAVLGFCFLCLLGLSVINDPDRMFSLQENAKQWLTELDRQRLPDAEEVINEENTDLLIAEDTLNEALLRENSDSGEQNVTEETTEPSENVPQNTEQSSAEADFEPETTETVPETTQEAASEAIDSSAEQEVFAQPSGPEYYVIRKGDTLIGISMNKYGTDGMVENICNMNGIKDPDDIKVGQEIILP